MGHGEVRKEPLHKYIFIHISTHPGPVKLFLTQGYSPVCPRWPMPPWRSLHTTPHCVTVGERAAVIFPLHQCILMSCRWRPSERSALTTLSQHLRITLGLLLFGGLLSSSYQLTDCGKDLRFLCPLHIQWHGKKSCAPDLLIRVNGSAIQIESSLQAGSVQLNNWLIKGVVKGNQASHFKFTWLKETSML